MNKPYIVCHMMMTVDGRIDCSMTEKIKGGDEYYQTLKELDLPSTLSGKVTAQMEIAQKGTFEVHDPTQLLEESFSKKIDSIGYDIIVDTKGTLLWSKYVKGKTPIIIISSEKVTKEYLAYLDKQGISWIATGKDRIDLKRAVDILYSEFGVIRLGIVGGGHINASFLDEGLLDEVSIVLGPGIDGRANMTSTFDGLSMDREPFDLTVKDIRTYEDGTIWVRYLVDKK